MIASTSKPTPTIADSVSAMPDLAGRGRGRRQDGRREPKLTRVPHALRQLPAASRTQRDRLNNGGSLSGLSLARQWVTRHRPSRCTRKRENANGISSFPIRAYCGRMSRFHRAPDDQAAPDSAKSPYAGLDYLSGETPSTAAIGSLAKDLVSLTGIGPVAALSAAVLFDRGLAGAAMELVSAGIAGVAAGREAARERAELRRAQ
jgi:hypothetical protein